MIEHQTKIKVRYGETDKMGYVHHSSYVLYLEEARMEYLSEIGLNYKEIEDTGIILPLSSLKIRYSSPIFFDDIITIVTRLEEPADIKLVFTYKIYNQKHKLVSRAETTLAFVDSNTRKLIPTPKDYLGLIENPVEV
jgi:acyl-CoA thioester hydrolase